MQLFWPLILILICFYFTAVPALTDMEWSASTTWTCAVSASGSTPRILVSRSWINSTICLITKIHNSWIQNNLLVETKALQFAAFTLVHFTFTGLETYFLHQNIFNETHLCALQACVGYWALSLSSFRDCSSQIGGRFFDMNKHCVHCLKAEPAESFKICTANLPM